MVDAFRWLEEDTVEVLAWQQTESRAAAAHLRGSPAWSRALATASRFAVPALTYRPPERYGERWFRERVPDGARNPVLEVAATPDGPGRVLVDLTDREGVAVPHWRPSPDGRLLAWGVPGSFRVVDVDSGEVLVDGLPDDGVHRVTWLPAGTGLFCVVNGGACSTTHLVRLPGPVVERQELPATPVTRWVTVSPDGRWVLAHSAERPHHVLDLRSGPGWAPFLPGATGHFRGAVVGDEFVAVTDEGAPDGRVVAVPLPGPGPWRELVPEGDGVLFSVTGLGSELVLAGHADGASRLRRIAPDGTALGEVPLPDRGMVWAGPGRDDAVVTPTAGGCTFSFSSLTRSPATYHYTAGAARPRRVTAPRASVEGAVVRCGVADGVPYKVVCKGEPDGPRPLVIGAYGALNIAWLPAYLSALPAAWVELGGVYVHAHLRGGGEYGADWWRAARRRTKQTTFDDLYRVAADLVERGWTTPGQLGVFGFSLGALTAAVAVVQRPRLFRACVAVMPLLDLLNCRRDAATLADVVTLDLGDPRDPADAAVLRTFSPYHLVHDGTPYPAVLLDCGEANPTCPPWHGRKMAARLRQGSSSGHPVLLRVRPGGHLAETAPADVARREAEHLAFFAEELGL
ncbi:prolyl oligopeptidase family serine peptidase [Saccharothrix syringae]|uniref:prolyl oligopeptidase n=1 Tax=Saccharothrix syringae TaxID=103733 RepID=A0A5Q0H2U5_SACSY|nr:prolyl oligopeptidase family serine peptidase [Saccharothrix syringae]QFZ20255.1 S9 family peptidase [Saccharothrix syringae]